MPRIMKAEQLSGHERIMPVGSAIARPRGDQANPTMKPSLGMAQVPASQRDAPVSSVQVSADSLERTQRLLREVIAAFGRQRNELLEQAKPAVVQLVMTLATEVVGRELAADDTTVLRVVERALDELGREGRVVARVNPEDAEMLRNALDDGRWAASVRAELEVVADSAVDRGGCVLDSDYGQIDATVQTQMAQLARLLGESEPNRE